MLQTLFKNDLVDELSLMIIPITLGTGKRLFQDGTIPASFKVTDRQISPTGIIIANYLRDGDVKPACLRSMRMIENRRRETPNRTNSCRKIEAGEI